MKYLTILFLFLSGCATAKPTLDSCMEKVNYKIEQIDHTKLSGRDQEGYEEILFIVCRHAKNDPDLAKKILDSIRYAH